jgi:p-hydroxybenzoate 3-monooxygenase
MRTQVGIIGAGPSGLLLSQILSLHGIDTVILERQTRAYCEGRIRAGVLEQGTVDLLKEAKVNARLDREGLIHGGVELCFHGRRHRIDFVDLTGKAVTVYGQTEVVKDLIGARIEAGAKLVFEAEDVSVSGLEVGQPTLRYRKDGQTDEVRCDFIAGCDGFHGVSRPSIPRASLHVFERTYPFAWLGILAPMRPVSEELIYANSDRGFALYSMRSMTLSRLYVQCSPDDPLENWPDERVWEELRRRLDEEAAERIAPTPLLEKSITPMRSFVVQPMRYGRLFLVGDAAHIVPPTGAKGLNLAAADVHVLSRALAEYYKTGSARQLDAYSDVCLRRVWKAQRFSWWLTSLMHRFPEATAFEREVQLAELDYLVHSRAASTALAENYVGLPFED